MMSEYEIFPKVGVIGLNHKTADLTFREAMARGSGALSGEKGRFFSYPIVLLSTCNRTEIYFSGEDLSHVHGALLAFLRTSIQEPFEHRLYSYFGIDCFVHLAKVASGLDSAILAETEIQRQVKVAYKKGQEVNQLPACLHYIFQKSLQISKKVRSQLFIEKGDPTLFQAMWQIAVDHLPQIMFAKVLFVGYSEINRAMALFLMKKGIQEISLATRFFSTACLQGCKIYGREALQDWSSYDLIICTAHAADYLVEGVGKKQHLIFDLSVPRNVDPAIGNQKGVFLYNIEQLNSWIDEKKLAQKDQILFSENLVIKEVFSMVKRYSSKLSMSRESREGDHIADVFHASGK